MNPYLQIKETKTEDGTYYYSERRGKDSVAFVLYASEDDTYGLINEFKPPLGISLVTAFGGSLDKDKSLSGIVVDEVEEEGGFRVSEEDLIYKGSFMATTQSSEVVHLYLVCISNSDTVGRKPQNKIEEQSEVIWIKKEDAKLIKCWKARLIIGV